MLQDIRPFRPGWRFSAANSMGVTVAVTGVSQALTIPAALGGVTTRPGFSMRVVNNGTDIVWLRADTAATATPLTSLPVLPNTSETFWLNPGITNINVIGSTGSGSTIYINFGESA